MLEASSIAWPNAAMWRQPSFVAPYFAQQMSPRQACEGSDAHGHSPRHPTMSTRPVPPPGFGTMQPPEIPTLDPFIETRPPSFANGWRQSSSGDVSMHDCSNSNTRANSSRHVTDPMLVCERTEPRFNSMQTAGAFEYTCEALTNMPSAPKNTPQSGETTLGNPTAVKNVPARATMEAVPSKYLNPRAGAMISHINLAKVDIEEADPKATALLATTIRSSVRGRKENVQNSPNATDSNSTDFERVARKLSQQLPSSAMSGTKRQRAVTPVASKITDDNGELRASPSLRMSYRGSVKQEGRNAERRVLSGIQNIN